MCVSSLPQRIKLHCSCPVGICKDGHSAKRWHCFDQELLSFAVEFGRENTQARCVAVWARQRVHQTGAEHVVCNRKDWNSFCRLLCGADCQIPDSCNDIDGGFDQLCDPLGQQIRVHRKCVVNDREVLTFNKALLYHCRR